MECALAVGGDGEVGECSLGIGSRVGLGGLGLRGFGGFAFIFSTVSWIFRDFRSFLALIIASALGVSSLFKPREIKKDTNKTFTARDEITKKTAKK